MKASQTLVIAFCAFFLSSAAFAQVLNWKHIYRFPNETESILFLENAGNSMYAGTAERGVFRKKSADTTWQRLEISSKIALCMTSVDSVLYVGTNGEGIFRSTNGGAVWTTVNEGIAHPYILEITHIGKTLFTTTSNGNLYRLRQGFGAWELILRGTGGDYPTKLYAKGEELFLATVYNDLIYSIFKSPDLGKTWELLTEDMPAWIGSLASSGISLFAGTERGVYRSTDFGAVWKSANIGLSNYVVSAFASVGSLIFTATPGGVFVSTNTGLSWNSTTLKKNVWNLAVLGNQLFAGTKNSGVYQSNDYGATWFSVNFGFPQSVNTLTATSGEIFAGTTSGGIFQSEDGGKVWKNVGLTGIEIFSVSADSNGMIAGTKDGLYRMEGRENTWSIRNKGLFGSRISDIVSLGNEYFVGTKNGVFRSSDNALTWGASGLSGNVQALFTQGNSLIAGLETSGIYKSADHAWTWNPARTGLTSNNVRALLSSSSMLLAGTSTGIFRSVDSGSTWFASEFTKGVSRLARFGSLLFAINEEGVYYSVNDGKSWRQANEGLADISVQSLTFFGNQIFVGTSEGNIFAAEIPTIPNEPKIEVIPSMRICRGHDTTFEAKISGGVQPFRFSWKQANGNSLPSGEILGGGGQSDSLLRIQPAQDRIVRVLISDALGREDSTDIRLDVILPPQPYIERRGNELECTLADNVRYLWLNAQNQPILGATMQRFSPSSNGIYKVRIITTEGCENVSPDFDFVVTAVTESERMPKYPEISPNPIHIGEFISLQFPSSTNVQILDILGREIYRELLPSGDKKIRVGNWSAGIYVINIEYGTTRISKIISIVQ